MLFAPLCGAEEGAATETVLIVDFGGQYKELIARRVREQGVYSVIRPNTVTPQQVRALSPIGIIFTGGPSSVYADGAPLCDPELLHLGIPVLGICYGMQAICHLCGGTVASCEKSEYGVLPAVLEDSALFSGCEGESRVLMSHTDRVFQVPEGFCTTAYTELCPIAAFENAAQKLYGVQFHPEVENTERGAKLLKNFLYEICGAKGGYTMENYLAGQLDAVRRQVGQKRVLLALSGGVDSSVCAALLSRAIPGQLTCIYVDHGLMRLNETEEIRSAFSGMALDFVCVDAREEFLQALCGVSDPEKKRKTIGRLFAKVFEREAKEHGGAAFLAQGTIYPDVVESGVHSAVIKSHHNVGGLPHELGFEGVIEPLRGLFKDEVRKLGKMLGLPDALIWRQPFPGPGLGIRVLGEVTNEKLTILRLADAILREEVLRSGEKPDQYFAVLTDTRSIGVMGDSRTYEYTLALRAVRTNDFMTCEFSRLPWELLARIATRITNEVRGINRVVYDITSKPPATIEWE